MRTRTSILAAALALLLTGLAARTAGAQPLPVAVAYAASVCADYPNQAAAQRAHDTRDGDHDGIDCEDLPCPCLKPGQGSGGSGGGQGSTPTNASCTTPKGVQSISFSATKYPHIKRHTERAIRRGWPTVLVVNRPDEDARRDRLLAGWPTRPRYDRDEYPPAVGRGSGTGLTRGSHPRGWKADVAYVPSSENRSHGSVLGIKLRRFCNGTRFRYVFY
jgi:hypothetical protein